MAQGIICADILLSALCCMLRHSSFSGREPSQSNILFELPQLLEIQNTSVVAVLRSLCYQYDGQVFNDVIMLLRKTFPVDQE